MGNSNVKYVAGGLVAVVLIAMGIVLFMPREPKIVRNSDLVPSEVDEGNRDFTEEGDGSRTIERSGRRGSMTQDRNGRVGSDDLNAVDGEEPSGTEVTEGVDGSEPQGGGEGGANGAGGAGVIIGPDGKPIGGQRLTGGAGGPGGGTEGGQSGTQTNRGTAGEGGLAGGESGVGNVDGGAGTEADEEEEDAEEAEGTVSVIGYVMRGSRGIDAARLSLTSADTGRARSANSDTEGFYQFSGLAGGEYYLHLMEPASPNARRTIFLRGDEGQRQEDFVIPEQPPIQGDVYDADTGDGVTGAIVEVMQGATMIGARTTDEFGHFELFPLEPGNYTVRASNNSYEKQEKTITISASNPYSEVLEFRLSRAGNIVGVVVNPGGSPLSGAYVSLFSGAAYGDATSEIRSTSGGGRFEFPALDPGLAPNYRVGGYYEGYVPAYSAPLTGQTLDEVRVTLGTGGTLTGTVVTSEGDPIPDAEITIQSGFPQTGAIFQRINVPFPSTTTNADGRFTLSALEPGAITLAIAAEGYVSNNASFTATDSTQDVGQIQLDSTDEAKEGRIFGVVIDETGSAMQNHNIFIKGTSGSWSKNLKTDSRGGFTVDEVPEGQYVIYTNGSTLRGDVFMTMDQTYPFARPGDEQIFLVYDMGQTARIRVVNSAGEPIKRFRIGVNTRYNGASGNGGIQETIANAYSNRLYETVNGEATLDYMIAGTSQITVTVENVGTEELNDVRIPVGGQVDLGDIVIDTGVSVRGQVVANGSPVSGALVEALPPNGQTNHPLNSMKMEARTQSDGSFSIGGLPEGAADFQVTKSGMTRERVRNVNLPAGEQVDLGVIQMVPSAILAGTVRDQNGQPISEILISVSDQLIITDLQGQYRTDTVEAGTQKVTASDRTDRFDTQTQEITLTAGQQTTLDFTMVPLSR